MPRAAKSLSSPIHLLHRASQRADGLFARDVRRRDLSPASVRNPAGGCRQERPQPDRHHGGDRHRSLVYRRTGAAARTMAACSAGERGAMRASMRCASRRRAANCSPSGAGSARCRGEIAVAAAFSGKIWLLEGAHADRRLAPPRPNRYVAPFQAERKRQRGCFPHASPPNNKEQVYAHLPIDVSARSLAGCLPLGCASPVDHGSRRRVGVHAEHHDGHSAQ